MRVWIGLVALAVAGCSRSPGTVGATIRQMMPSEISALASAKGLPPSPGVRLVTSRFDPSDLTPRLVKFLIEKGYSYDAAYLRNPGVYACVVRRNPYGQTLNEGDVDTLTSYATQNGDQVSTTLRAQVRYGPDGKTPMILQDEMKYSPEDPKAMGEIIVTLTLPSQALAAEAAHYIAPPYKTRIEHDKTAWRLIAEIHEDTRKDTDEIPAFEALAKRFGGTSSLESEREY